MDPLEEREILRDCLIGRQGAVARYAAAFPAALAELLAAVKELQHAGPFEMILDDPWSIELNEITEDFRSRTRNRRTPARMIELATETLGRKKHWPVHILVAGVPHPEGDVVRLLTAAAKAGAALRIRSEEPVQPKEQHHHLAADLSAELRLAAHLCMDASARGVPLNEMVLAAPSLGEYVPYIVHAFACEGVPVRPKAETPLLGEPRAALCSHLAQILFGTASRSSWAAIAGSPLLRDPIPPQELHCLEVFSREQRLHGRNEDTRTLLNELCEKAPSAAAQLLQIADLANTNGKTLTFKARADLLRQTQQALLRTPTSAAREKDCAVRIEACLQSISLIDPAGAKDEDFLDELHDLLSKRGLAMDSGIGVHLIEYKDLPAYPARHIHLLGLHRDAIPGASPNTQFLTDPLRASIPGMASAEVARERERKLLESCLAQGADTAIISRPRRDGRGKATSASPWLEELAPQWPKPTYEPTHPGQRAKMRIETGICPRDLCLIDLTLQKASVQEIAEVAGDTGTEILARAQGLETFSSDDLGRDGVVSPELVDLTRAESMYALEKLATCPQQYLFSRAMGLRPLPRDPDPLSLPADRAGSIVHEVMENALRSFRDRLGAAEDPTTLASEILNLARTTFGEQLRDEPAIHRCEIPVLRDLFEKKWWQAIEEAIRFDLEIMNQDGSRPIDFERNIEGILEPARPDGSPVALPLRGRVDRIDRLADGDSRVIDYKTGANPDKQTNTAMILKGRKPQLIAYGLLLHQSDGDGPAELEIRKIRPATSANDEQAPRSMLADCAGWMVGSKREAIDETLAVLAELRTSGAFVPAPDPQHCSWCDFRLACRRLHPPSHERVGKDGRAELRRYFELAKKSSRQLMLPDDGTEKAS